MKIFVIAGELSGDLHGANLVREIKKINSFVQFLGYGGNEMAEAGVDIRFELAKIPIMGFTGILKNYFILKQALNRCKEILRDEKPDAVILIDYPGFNLRIAEYAKSLGITVIYYISPQVWVWGKGRIKKIQKYVDKMLVIFSFEEKLYKDYNIPVEFVGHPVLDIVKPSMSVNDAYLHFGIKTGEKVLSLFPGSREQEIKRLLPVMAKACKMTQRVIPEINSGQALSDSEGSQNEKLKSNMRFLLALAPSISKKQVQDILIQQGCENLIDIVEDKNYDILNISTLALVASGTVTLEATCLNTPMIIVYKTSILTYIIARLLVRIKYIGLPNILAKKEIVTELLQSNVTAERLAEETIKIFNNDKKIAEIKQELAGVKLMLGSVGAAQKAAKAVLSMVKL
ncbi:MAG: lipid-A-disaccharide synthase [Candidatus Firestonebacteria bacterium]